MEKKRIKYENTIKKLILSVLAIIFTSIYPVLFIFLQNLDEVSFKDIELPLVTYLMIAVVFFAFSILVFFDIEKASIYSCVVMFFFVNFVLIQNIIATIFSIGSFVSLGIVVFIFLIIFFFFLRRLKMELDIAVIMVDVLFVTLIVINIISAIPIMLSKKEEIKQIKVEQNANKYVNKNIYYLLFDEYGGTENLKYYCDYDNCELKNYLENKGFSWSDETYNVESIYTYDIVPNILNINYVSKVGSAPSRNIKYTKNPVLYRFFENMGYEVNIINQENYLEESGCNVLTKKQKKADIANNTEYVSKLIFQQSLISVISSNYVKKRIESDSKGRTTEGCTTELDEVLDCTLNICNKVNKPSFNMCYILCPHAPFLYNSKGEYIKMNDMENYEKKDLYIEQLKYVNNIIRDIVNNIIDNDPNSIIVIQSDHGYRYAYHCMKDYKKKEYDAKKETLMMQNVLNCVYIGGEENIDISGDSCINSWRKILNKVYDTNYDIIEYNGNYQYKWRYTNVMQ